MFSTEGVAAVATITELRDDTTGLIEYAHATGREIMVHRNNEPLAVLLSWPTYLKLKDRVDFHAL